MRPLDWAELAGWTRDDHAAARAAFDVSADLAGFSDLTEAGDARRFFEEAFEPVEVCDPGTAHFTGYYEPELAGSRVCSTKFPAPLHSAPDGLSPDHPWHTRAEIVAGDLLARREIAFVESPIAAFLAQVQGSVRIRLAEGGVLRLGFAAKNGHPYTSIGAELLRRGEAAPMTPEAIRAWCAAHPDEVQDLLNHNASYVFFRELDTPEDVGPLGAMGRPVTPGRSLAVDPEVIPLGSPVWVEVPGFGARLMVAQDIGSAIKGPGRGDIFFGSGPYAGIAAGAMNTRGRMIWLRRRT